MRVRIRGRTLSNCFTSVSRSSSVMSQWPRACGSSGVRTGPRCARRPSLGRLVHATPTLLAERDGGGAAERSSSAAPCPRLPGMRRALSLSWQGRVLPAATCGRRLARAQTWSHKCSNPATSTACLLDRNFFARSIAGTSGSPPSHSHPPRSRSRRTREHLPLPAPRPRPGASGRAICPRVAS